MQSEESEVLIVGGSLAGLTFALACATRGVRVRVIERSQGHVQGGDSLSVDLQAIRLATGFDPRASPSLPVVPAYRELTTWNALYRWLRNRVEDVHGITIEEGLGVESAFDEGQRAGVILSDGTYRYGSAVVGADGYRSIVRRAISPEMPFARYAGYLVWRGLVDERHLVRPVTWPADGGLWIEFVAGYRLVAATLPGPDGSLELGYRQVTFAWFDVHQDDLLRSTGCLTADGSVVGSLARGMIDAPIREKLTSLVPTIWPDGWADAVAAGINADHVLSGAPIAEYKPKQLVRGRLAIIGDAAHVVSPMTGRGYLTGVEDAGILARTIAGARSTQGFEAALAKYENLRLPFVRGLADHSMRISGDYRRYAESERSNAY